MPRPAPRTVRLNRLLDKEIDGCAVACSGPFGGSTECPSVRYLPSDGYYYVISGGHTVELARSKDLLSWEASNQSTLFIMPSSRDVLAATSVMKSAATNLQKGGWYLSAPHRQMWDHASNDADMCCESWGGASPAKGAQCPFRSRSIFACYLPAVAVQEGRTFPT